MSLDETIAQAADRLVEYREHASIHPRGSLPHTAWMREADLMDAVLKHLHEYKAMCFVQPSVSGGCRSQRLQDANIV
jgi:D-arabinose 5-phosphate isomerase GutQ